MLAVNPISNVRFGEGPASILEREGAFSKPKTDAASSNNANPAAVSNEASKSGKKSNTGKKVVGTIVGLAVVAAALAALPKVFPNAIKELPKADRKGFMKIVGHYVATVGNTISKYTYEPVVNLFKGKAKKAPKAPNNANGASIIA